MRFLLFTLLGTLLLSAPGVSQQTTTPVTALRHPEFPIQKQRLEQGLAATAAPKLSLQTQAKRIFDKEMARESAGDCKTAETTVAFNQCFGEQRDITAASLKRFEEVIRRLILNDQQNQPQQDTAFVAGQSLTPQHLLAEFDRVEAARQQYDSTACAAAFHQFGGGTGGPSFELQCEIALIRNHMRELNLIYGGDLRL